MQGLSYQNATDTNEKSHRHHSPHPRRANKTSDTTHPSSDECTGQHSNVLVQRRRSHSNVKQSPLEKRKATNIFPARPGTESGMSLQNSVDINLSSRFQQSTPTEGKLTTTCNADGVGTYREGSPEPERPTSARGSQGTIERD